MKEEVAQALQSIGVLASEDQLEIPPQPQFGDLAFPCFDLAKKEKKSPREVAKDIARKIELGGIISKVEVKGGYVNFFLDFKKIAESTLKKIIDEKQCYGSSGDKKKIIMVEYAQPNTHKGFHIGHLRNICLGESLSRILEFSGYKVVRTNYQGDIGPHVAKCLWGFINLHEGESPKKNRGEWLGKVYAEATKKVSTDEKLEKEVREINTKLYSGDKTIVELWKITRSWSLQDFEKIYKELDVKFDKLYFESEVEKRAVEIAKELLKKGELFEIRPGRLKVLE